MPKGPRGEKRPISPVSSMVMAMEVATGIKEEEYVDGRPRLSEESSDDFEENALEIAARRIADPSDTAKPKKQKKAKKAPSK